MSIFYHVCTHMRPVNMPIFKEIFITTAFLVVSAALPPSISLTTPTLEEDQR